MTLTIDKIVCPSHIELKARYLSKNRPVVLTDYVQTWPASGRWSPEYFVERFEHKKVPVVTMKDGDYANAKRQEMRLSDYVQWVLDKEQRIERGESSDSTTEDTHYLAQTPIKTVFPELLSEISEPPFFEQERFSSSVMYAGGTLFSQLHYHPRGSALLCMLYGQKTVRLFPPDQSRYLYPHSMGSGLAHVSQTRHKHPDKEQFPEFEKARYVEVTLQAGECLFIPIYWWHSIENTGFSISAVFFWSRTWASRFLPPPGPRAPYLYQPVAEGVTLGKRVARKLSRVLSDEPS